MDRKEAYYLGKVVKPFGFKGDLVLFFDVDQPEEYSELDGVYIEKRNNNTKPEVYDG